MKSKLAVVLPLISISLLASCNNSVSQEKKVSLTYGTNITLDTVSDLKELTNDELLVKTRDEEEVFLLAVYQGDYSKECLCWSTFKEVVRKYMNVHADMVYLYNAHNQNEESKSLGIEKLNNSTPYLYVFNGQKVIAKFSYNNRKDKAIFEDTTSETMYKRVMKVVNRSQLIYIDELFIKTCNVKSNNDVVVMFMRSGCGDCKYALPNVVIPYFKEHKIEVNLYLYDMQKVWEDSHAEGASESQAKAYQNLKDEYGLSEKGNATFGYKNGVVPTIQKIRGGVIKDAAVYFNDSVSKKEDGSYYISSSYYSESRLANLTFLKDKKDFPTILEGMTITDGVLEMESGGYYFTQNAANVYHKPIFEAFLDYYLS